MDKTIATDIEPSRQPLESSEGDTITVLSNIDQIRQRSGTYIGDNAELGLETIVREILDNAVDEYPNFPDKEKPIILHLYEDNIVSVRDYGRGISPYPSKKQNGAIEERLAYTLMGSGGKFRENREKNGNRFAGGLNGIGACATNAMSEFFHVEIWKDGYYFEDHYVDAIPQTPLKNGQLPKKKLDIPETGTRITFKPSSKYLRATTVNADKLALILQQTAYLHPKLRLEFTNKRDGEDTVVYYSEHGLLDYMDALAVDEDGQPVSFLIKPFLIHGSTEVEILEQMNHMEVMIAVAFTRGEASAVKTFTNGIENPAGGKHLQGFYQGVIDLLQHYYEEFQSDFQKQYKTQLELIQKVNNLTNTSEIFKKLRPRDIARKIFVIIDFKHDDPILHPQSKDELASPEAKPAVAKIFYERASLYLDKNIQAVQELIGFLIKELYEKAKAEDTTIPLSKSEIKLTISSKLAAASSKDPKKKEIFLVEGDSAGGGVNENRDAKYQAVLPLRGKILNAKKTTLAKLLANPEIAAFITALGTGIGSKYDESKLQYWSINITADQDVDGLHITILILTVIMVYMPDLIRNGHVYILETPLYVNIMKKGDEDVYTYSESEQAAFVAKHRKQISEIQRNKGLGELTKEEVIKTILTPETRRRRRFVMHDEDAAYNLLEELMGKDVQSRRELFTNGRKPEITDNDSMDDSDTIDIQGFLRKNFYAYGMSVIEERALPDIRDGLKPVHRAIAYEILKTGGTSDSKPKKVAKISGAVIGNWHPHGDKAVEDALTGLAQPWTNTLPVVYIKGNGGSIFGDRAASGRYIETRLTPAGDAYGHKLKEGIVPYVPNFDDTSKMPTILPAQLPYTLINGIRDGIAVGVAAAMPPHNAKEVLLMLLAYLKDPKLSTESLLEYMPGPDFPSGATIINKDDLLDIYETGRGKLIVRATLEYDKKEHALHVKEIPYCFAGSMDNLVKELAVATTETVNPQTKKKTAPKITGVTQVNNYSGRDGIDICLELQKGINPEEITKTLFAKTRLETSVSFIFNALNDKKLHTYSLRRYLKEYTEFQHEILSNEYQLEVTELTNRMEIIKGHLIAAIYVNEIVDIVKHANGRAQVIDVLMYGTILSDTNPEYHDTVRTFAFTEAQAESIAEKKLYQLNKMDVIRLKKEGESVQKQLKIAERIVADKAYRHKLIIKRLESEYQKLPDVERKTRIIQDVPSKASTMELPTIPLYIDMDKYGYVRIEGKAFEGAKASDNKSRIGFFDEAGTCWNLFLDKVKETKDRGVLASMLLGNTETIVGFSSQIIEESSKGLFIFQNGAMRQTDMSKYLTKTRAIKVGTRTGGQPLKAFYDIPSDVNTIVIDGTEIPLTTVPEQGLSGKGKRLLTPKEEPYEVSFKQGVIIKERTATKPDIFDGIAVFTTDGQLRFDWATTDTSQTDGLYVTTYQQLISDTLLFIHTDGTAKKVQGSQFAVKTKRTQIVADKEGMEILCIRPDTEASLVGIYEDGKQKRIDAAKIPVQGKTGGGVRVFYTTKYRLVQVESGEGSNFPIVSFATQPK